MTQTGTDQPTEQRPASAAPRREPPRVFVQPGFPWDRLDAYLFDIDGTLLRDPDGVHYKSFFHGVRQTMGYDISFEGVTLHGSLDPAILRDAFRAAGIDDAVWKPHLKPILATMCETVASQKHLLQPIVMPGVENTLRHLADCGAALGLATGNLETIGWLKVEAAGLREWFRFGGFSDRFEVRSQMIAHALDEARRIAGAAATVCVVGDTPADIAAARANALPVIAVATGHYLFDDLMQHQPEVCATSLEDLMHLTAGR